MPFSAENPVATQTTQTTEPAPNNPAPETQVTGDPRQGLQNPLFNVGQEPGASTTNNEPEPGSQETNPETGEPTPQTGDNPPAELEIPDKFKLPDGSINTEALLKSYIEAEKKISEQGTQLGQVSALQEELAQLKAMIEQAQKPPEAQPQQPPQPTPEEIAKYNEQFMEQFYENPIEALGQMMSQMVNQAIQQNVNPMLQPIMQQFEQQQKVEQYSRQIEECRQKYQDFDTMLPAMQNLIQEKQEFFDKLPEGEAMEVAYHMAKSQQLKPPEQLLQDPNFLQQVMQNETVKNSILKNYAQGVKQNQPPVVIGNQPAAVPPAAPPTEIKSTSDAKKAALSYFQRIFGGGK